ncbi:DUF6240 domain-containing protein [Anaeromicrobium sediminis]|uniref:Flagellar hook-length control protein-like C-terminal domain-containing protein n=1 Tax=Anaeromicrobium sediminis TaxID=1478221 RepID=A0A267MIF2_9FIRM|nr:DUF6240 domain-containing protein [Anaeromicrobium sediminis]PAB59361.1 hypothetical protein CCE28_10905 [Anaeromicrobium sediminis]
MLNIKNNILNKINLYDSLPKNNLNMEGIVLEKDNKELVLQTKTNKLNITLKEDMDIGVGDKVNLKRNQIEKMEVVKEDNITKGRYETILESMGLEANERNIEAIKELEENGMKINSENVGAMVASKDYLDIVKENLDYDMALKLEEKDIDISKDSLYKIAKAIESINKEDIKVESKVGELTTEEAEKIAKSIYGADAGKDIIDIIKSLHKEGMDINKDQIEKIYKLFYKLDSIKDIGDEIIVNLYRGEKSISIESLYRNKMNITTGDIGIISGSNMVANMYESTTIKDNNISLYEEENVKAVKVKKIIDNLNEKLDYKIVNKLSMDIDGEIEEEDIEILEKKVDEINEEIGPVENKEKGKSFLVKGLKRVLDVDKILNKIKTLKPEHITYHEGRKLSFTLKNIEKTYDEMNYINMDKKIDLKEIDNIQMEYDKLQNTLTPEKIIEMTKMSYNVLTMPMEEINRFKIKKSYDTKLNIINNISKYDKKILPVILKNNINLTLNEIGKVQKILKGEESFMETIQKALTSLETSPIIEEQIKEIKRLSKDISDNMKDGKNIEKEYEKLLNLIGDMNNNSHFSQQNKNEMEGTINNIRLYKKLNNKDTFIDIPIEINGNMKNLQIYMKNKEVTSDGLNMALYLDTNSLGKLNINVNIKNNNVSMDIISKPLDSVNEFQGLENFLKKNLESVGYNLHSLNITKENEVNEDVEYVEHSSASFVDMVV